MKRLTALMCTLIFAALVIPCGLLGQEQQQKAPHTYYIVQDLGTLGGTFSGAFDLNDRGSVDGASTIAGDTETHAFLWRKGQMTDLGTFGGPNTWPMYRHNERDEVVGFAETSTPDPFGDDSCGFGTYLICLPFLWRNGVMIALPTLGGNNGVAGSINNRDQIVGGVDNSTREACGAQFKPVLWENGRIVELPTLSGDTVGRALMINDRGQAVGFSATSTCNEAWHAVLWQDGTATYLGSLGGTFSNVANGINNQGQVSGWSALPNDTTYHAFLWEKHSGMKDLGTLSGDTASQAWGLDNQGRVVGSSCDEMWNCRAFLWQHDVMADLNALIPADSPWFLLEADSINPRGEIVGRAFNSIAGEVHAVLLHPRKCGQDVKCDALDVQSSIPRLPVALPENVRKLLQEHIAHRYPGLRVPLPR